MTVRWEHEDGWKGKRGRSINSCRNIQVVFILIYNAALLRVLYNSAMCKQCQFFNLSSSWTQFWT